jgi:hypothetical protein
VIGGARNAKCGVRNSGLSRGRGYNSKDAKARRGRGTPKKQNHRLEGSRWFVVAENRNYLVELAGGKAANLSGSVVDAAVEEAGVF